MLERIATRKPLPDSRSVENGEAAWGTGTEQETWRAFKAGSEPAFAYLYNQYVHALFHYGNRITPDRELIQDCIQDLFVELWRNRRTLGATDSVKFYLYKALKRKLIKKLVTQRKRGSESLPDDYHFDLVFSPEFDLIARQISQEQKDRLLLALNALTPRQKEAITLKFYDGLSYPEVAALLSMSVKSTYNLIYRAIDVLKQSLGKFFLLLLFSC